MNPLNYTTNAIEFQKDLNASMRTRGASALDVAGMEWLMSVMARAQKFALPDGGRLFAVAKNPTVDDLDRITSLFKLPYPAVIVEYAHPKDMGINNVGGSIHAAPKRIGVAIETTSTYFDEALKLMPAMQDIRNRDGVLFGSVFIDENDIWSFPVWLFFVPYDVEIKSKKELQLSDGYFEAMKLRNMEMEGALLTNLTGFVVNPLVNDLMRQHGKSTNFIFNDQLMNTQDEMTAILELCAVLNCSNVTSFISQAPHKLNKKRATNGKTPFFDYHILELSPMTPKALTGTSSGAAGERSSPRAHLRRGHIRRLKRDDGSIKMIWINAMVVGDATRGVTVKDYSIQRPL
jgi:hypothetical protein